MIGRAKKRKDRAKPKMRIAKPKDWGPCACSQKRMPGRLREALLGCGLLGCGCTHMSRWSKHTHTHTGLRDRRLLVAGLHTGLAIAV